MRRAARLNALLVARAVAADDVEEFLPVDFAEPVVFGLVVPLEIRIGNCQSEVLSLGNRYVNKLLP